MVGVLRVLADANWKVTLLPHDECFGSGFLGLREPPSAGESRTNPEP